MTRKFWEIAGIKGKSEVAWIYLLSSKKEEGVLVECVEALDPRYPVQDKWVIILSSQKGCPVKCRFCDAAFYFKGNLSREELLEQLEIIIFPHSGGDDCLNSKKVKLHFARMGEPSMNPAVLEVMTEIPYIYPRVNFIPTIATIAPAGREEWFERLILIKNEYYPGGRFQLQFSMNSTDESYRDLLMPVKKWRAEGISQFAKKYFRKGDRKITLNYALAQETPFDCRRIIEIFDPEMFLIKLTPVNPTESSARAGLTTALKFDGHYPESLRKELERLEAAGFEVIISIGSLEEIVVGSNCGQLAFTSYLKFRKISENRKSNLRTEESDNFIS